ncbi:MAG: LexA family protein [Candidatus Methylomirabilales bacterium]
MKDLSPKQRQALEAILHCLRQWGMPPILEEIAEVIGVKSRFWAFRHVRVLEKKGYIRRLPGLQILGNVVGLLRRFNGKPRGGVRALVYPDLGLPRQARPLPHTSAPIHSRLLSPSERPPPPHPPCLGAPSPNRRISWSLFP